MGSRGRVRPSRGMNIWEKYWKGKVRGHRKHENFVPERAEGKEGGRVFSLENVPSRFEAVNGNRRKYLWMCVCIRILFCLCVCVSISCADTRKAERVPLRWIMKCRWRRQRSRAIACNMTDHIGLEKSVSLEKEIYDVTKSSNIVCAV